jgi:ubiquinone/menaquinone biosynthesis C-methylase UbiE
MRPTCSTLDASRNYTFKMLSKLPNLNCTLNDLSLPMLEKARERVTSQTTGKATLEQSDMRNLDLSRSSESLTRNTTDQNLTY